MNKKMMIVLGLCGLIAVTDALCAKRPTQCERIGDKGYFDLVISCKEYPDGDNNGNHQPVQDSEYSKQDEIEAIIQYWSDALYEATEGAHFLRRIMIYTGGEKKDVCDILWAEQKDRPYADGTILQEKCRIYFFEEPLDESYTGNRANWELGGYTLAHESGHYLYGLYEEYSKDAEGKIPLPINQRVKCSIMNNSSYAAGRNYKCLNFSIKWQGGGLKSRDFVDWEDTLVTAQHTEFDRSCWETLAYEYKGGPSKADNHVINNLYYRHPFYEELQLVAPKGTNPPRIDLNAGTPLASLPSRTKLNIVWNPKPAKTIVIDKSSSMDGGGLDNAKAAACDLIDRVEDGTEVSILAFDASVTLVHDFLGVTNTANRTTLKSAVNGIALGSGTAVGDAARVALNNLIDYGLSNRTATVYLLTDGANNQGEDPYGVIPDYIANHVSFYGLGYGIEADDALGQMAMGTGGMFVNGLASVMDVKEAFVEANARDADRVIVAKGGVGAGVTAVDIPIVIDSTLTNDFRLTVNVSGGLGAAVLSLEEPGGAPVHTTAGKLEADGTATWDFWLATPVQGVWRLTGTKQSGAELRYICDAKTRGGTYYLSLADAEWDEEAGELVVLAWLGHEASTDGATVTVQVTLADGTVLDAVCTNFMAGAYQATFAGSAKGMFEGARVTVTASNPDGGAFETWREATCGASETPDAPIAENFVRVSSTTVVWPRVKLTVVDGTGSGRYRPGEAVSIAHSSSLPAGKFTFLRWAGDTQTVANVSAAQTTVTVTNDMTLRAVYQAVSPPAQQDYMVIDLATGAFAFQGGFYAVVGSVEYYNYKSTKIILRRIAADPIGSYPYPFGFYLSGTSGSYREFNTGFSEYYLAVFETTQGHWSSVMGAYPPSTYQGSNRMYYPAEQVTYADIRGTAVWPTSKLVDSGSFIGKLRALSGLAVDLPTEGQWHKAQWNNGLGYGISVEENAGWTSLNSGGTTHEVGTKPAGKIGLYDMVGNVKEWCLDRSGTPPGTANGNYRDPEGATSGSSRMQRGGSFKTSMANTGDYIFSDLMRWSASPTTKAADVGFRVALAYQQTGITVDGVARNVPVGLAIPVAAPDKPGYTFTGWSVDTTAANLGSLFDANAPYTFVTLPAGAGLTLTPLYATIPPPPPPYHDVTYEVAPVLVKGFKTGVMPGLVTLSWNALAGEEVMGYAVAAKAALADPEWDPLFAEDGLTLDEDPPGHFTAGIPDTLGNAEGKRYQFFQIRAVVEKE